MPCSVALGSVEPAALELLDQVGDALVAVAAVRVAGVREEADQRLVELHPLGLLGAVGRDRALGALGRDGAGPVGQQQADQGLEGEQVVLARRAAEQRGEGDLAQARAARAARFCSMPQKRPGSCRAASAEAPISVPNSCSHHGKLSAVSARDALARQRPPGQRGRDRGQHRGLGRMARQALQPAQEHRARRRAPATPASRRLRARIGRVGRQRRAGRRRRPARCRSLSLSEAPNSMPSPAAWKRSIMKLERLARRLLALRPDDGRRRGQHRIGRVAGLAAGLRRRQLGPAMQVDVGGDRGRDQLAVVLAAGVVQQRQRDVRLAAAAWPRRSMRGAVQAADLRLRVHLRGARGVLHRLARHHAADLRVEQRHLLVVGRQRLAPRAGAARRAGPALRRSRTRA